MLNSFFWSISFVFFSFGIFVFLPFGHFVFLSFCHFVFSSCYLFVLLYFCIFIFLYFFLGFVVLLFCLFVSCLFVFVSFCLFASFFSRHFADQMSEGPEVSKVTLCVKILKWHPVTQSPRSGIELPGQLKTLPTGIYPQIAFNLLGGNFIFSQITLQKFTNPTIHLISQSAAGS